MPFDGSETEVEGEDIQRIRAMERMLHHPAAWCKGGYDRGAAHCLVGAIKASGLSMPQLMRSSVYKSMTWLARAKGFRGIEDFNDCPATHHADIRAFLVELREQWPMISQKAAHLHFGGER